MIIDTDNLKVVTNNGYKIYVMNDDSFTTFETMEYLRCEFDNVNWFNFNDGDIYYNENGLSYRVVSISHRCRVLQLEYIEA